MIKKLLKMFRLFYNSLQVKEIFSKGKPHLECLSLSTEVLFNHYSPVKQLNVLTSYSAYSSVYYDDLASWWTEGPEPRGLMRGTPYLSLMIVGYLCYIYPSPHNLSSFFFL